MVAEIRERSSVSAFGGDGRSLSHVLPTPENGWPPRPFEIVSLADMLSFFLSTYSFAFDQVRNQFYKVAILFEKRGPHAFLTEMEAKELTTLLGLFQFEYGRYKFDVAVKKFHQLRGLESRPNALDLESIKWALKDLLDSTNDEIAHKYFLVLDEDIAKLYKPKKPFGEEVLNAFPSTHHDAVEAKNCYALDRYTACVFHCMRVIEKGLHALVRDLNAKFGAAIVFKKDVEFINWGMIIDKIESEMTKLLRPSRVPLSQDDLRFYSQASKEFVYFKNSWRDDVSHSRSSYEDADEVKAIMVHVEAFMRKLAGGGIKE